MYIIIYMSNIHCQQEFHVLILLAMTSAMSSKSSRLSSRKYGCCTMEGKVAAISARQLSFMAVISIAFEASSILRTLAWLTSRSRLALQSMCKREFENPKKSGAEKMYRQSSVGMFTSP